MLSTEIKKMTEERRWLTAGEASEFLGVHLKTVYRLTARKRIPFCKIPGIGIRIDREDLERFLENRTVRPKDEV